MYHLCFCADENYIKYASVLMTSIIHNIDRNANFPQLPLHFHILTDTLSPRIQENLKALQEDLSTLYLCEIVIHFVDESPFKELPPFRGGYTTYWRLLIADYLPCDIPTCLYLDVDMLAFCDIREIFALNLGDSCLAAVPDFAKPKSENRIIQPIADSANSTPAPAITLENYFNAGFLYINLPKFRSLNIPQRVLPLSKQYHLGFHDQDILNAIIQDNYTQLSFAYNFIASAFGGGICMNENKRDYNLRHTREEFRLIMQKIKILHFTSEKPWRLTYAYQGKFIAEFFWEYAEKTPVFHTILCQSKVAYDTQTLQIGFLILQTQGFLAFLKLPFTIQKAVQENIQVFSPETLPRDNSANCAHELGKQAIRRSKSNKNFKYIRQLAGILRDKIKIQLRSSKL